MQKYFALSFLTLLLPLQVMAFTVPTKPTGFVSDYASMLTLNEKTALENKISQFERQTTNEISVVTVPSLDGEPIENLAQEIFTQWGIGKKDKNNGVLLLISLADHKTRIQTGYGVEGDLTDIGTSYIQSDIITPAFRSGKYADGINGAVDAMIKALSGYIIVPSNYSSNGNDNNLGSIELKYILIFGFIVLQWITSVLARSKSWWGGGVLGGVVALVIWHFFISSIFIALPLVFGLIGLGLLFDFIVSRAYEKNKGTGTNMPWFLGGGRFGGGSGGGGGFGGFGGGASGGGGSSGGW